MTVREHLEAIPTEAQSMRERLALAWLTDDRDALERIVGHAVAALAEWDRLLDRLGHAERAISFNGDAKSILQQIIKAES